MAEQPASFVFQQAINLGLAAGKDYQTAYEEIRRTNPELIRRMNQEGQAATISAENERRRSFRVFVDKDQVERTEAIVKTVTDHMKRTGGSWHDSYMACKKAGRFTS